MKLSEFKLKLKNLNQLIFLLPDGNSVPPHFHITEVAQVIKKFIDCGGVIRHETKVGFQLWEADDTEHRLMPEKLLNIIELAEKTIELQNAEIEVEYQGTTIGKYELDFNEKEFLLISTTTNCLAIDKCGMPSDKIKVKLKDLSPSTNNCCTPGGKCC